MYKDRFMKKSIAFGCVLASLLLGLGGCEKKSGDAVVIGKDYVAAAVKQGEEIKDERATNNEQWIVKVRMRDNGRTVQVHADRAQWEKLRDNDRVKVTYRVGKYTGTVWDAEIE
jgi:hydroxymethylpyrimidine/phosphomethylpyrimidine kinase